jgi:type III secretion system low calcium response chaperone LcrH/SycD
MTTTTISAPTEADINSVIAGEKQISEAVGLDDNQLERIYSIGYQLYLQHRFNDAHPILQLLAICNPGEGRYWNALAACRQMLGDFLLASETFAYAAKCDLANIEPAIQAAFCLIREEQADAAEAWIEEAGRRVNDTAASNQYAEKIRQLQRALGHLRNSPTPNPS